MSFTVKPAPIGTAEAPITAPTQGASLKLKAIKDKIRNGVYEAQHSEAPRNNVSPQGDPLPVANSNRVTMQELGGIRQKEVEKAPELNEIDGQPLNTEAPLEAQAEKPAEEEAPKEATETKEEPLSQQYAILARKEKALQAKVRAHEAAVKAREDALRLREEAVKSKESGSDFIPKDKLMKDPFGMMQELGISYDQLTEMALNQPQVDSATKAYLDKLERETQAIREELKSNKQSQEEQQKKAYDQAVNQIRKEAQQLVKDNPDFETIKETGSVDDVVDLIEQTYKKSGELLSVEDAAKEVEEYLIEEALKISRIKKIQQRMAPATKPATQQQPEPKAAPQNPPQMKTLTNAVGTAKRLTARERALLAAQGKLNS